MPLNRKTKPNQTLYLIHVSRWLKSHNRVQVLSEGKYHYYGDLLMFNPDYKKNNKTKKKQKKTNKQKKKNSPNTLTDENYQVHHKNFNK